MSKKIYKISALHLPYEFSYGDQLLNYINDYDAVIYHSSFDAAFDELKNFQKNLKKENYLDDYLRFSIEEILVDEKNYWNVFEYDTELNLIQNYTHENMDKTFYGIKEDSSLHKKGQWVEFIMNGALRAGLITSTPLTESYIKEKNITNADQYDNSYTIIYFSEEPRDIDPHGHIMEHNILGPLKNAKLPVKHKIMVEERFKKYR